KVRKHKGQNYNGQDCMRDQDRQIDRPEPRWITEDCWPFMQVIMKAIVIGYIRNQEEHRRDERRNHAVAVRLDALTLDQTVPGGKEARTRAIQYRIRGRQVRKKFRYIHGTEADDYCSGGLNDSIPSIRYRRVSPSICTSTSSPTL